jgi:hypothetical protein
MIVERSRPGFPEMPPHNEGSMQTCGVNYAAAASCLVVVREAEAGIAMAEGIFVALCIIRHR